MMVNGGKQLKVYQKDSLTEQNTIRKYKRQVMKFEIM